MTTSQVTSTKSSAASKVLRKKLNILQDEIQNPDFQNNMSYFKEETEYCPKVNLIKQCLKEVYAFADQDKASISDKKLKESTEETKEAFKGY